MNLNPLRKKRYLVGTVCITCAVFLLFTLVEHFSQKREIDRLLSRLGAHDRSLTQDLNRKGQILFAAGRPETADEARWILTARDEDWCRWPEAAEVSKRLVIRLEQAPSKQKIATLKLLEKFGAVAAPATPEILLVLLDTDDDVRTAAKSAVSALNGGAVPEISNYPELLPRLQQRLESQVGKPESLSATPMVTTIEQLARFGKQAKPAVPLLSKMLDEKTKRDVFLAIPKALDAIEESWIEQTDQPRLLRLLLGWVRQEDNETCELAALLLPRLGPPSLGPHAASELPKLVSLTCHPSDALRNATWKAMAVINPTMKVEATVVKSEIKSMVSWASRAKSSEQGGKLLADSLSRMSISQDDVLDPLVLEMATASKSTQDLIATAFDRWSPKWRESDAILSLVASFVEYAASHDQQFKWPIKDERWWPEALRAIEWEAYRVANDVNRKMESEPAKQPSWSTMREDILKDLGVPIRIKVSRMSKPAQDAFTKHFYERSPAFLALLAPGGIAAAEREWNRRLFNNEWKRLCDILARPPEPGQIIYQASKFASLNRLSMAAEDARSFELYAANATDKKLGSTIRSTLLRVATDKDLLHQSRDNVGTFVRQLCELSKAADHLELSTDAGDKKLGSTIRSTLLGLAADRELLRRSDLLGDIRPLADHLRNPAKKASAARVLEWLHQILDTAAHAKETANPAAARKNFALQVAGGDKNAADRIDEQLRKREMTHVASVKEWLKEKAEISSILKRNFLKSTDKATDLDMMLKVLHERLEKGPEDRQLLMIRDQIATRKLILMMIQTSSWSSMDAALRVRVVGGAMRVAGLWSPAAHHAALNTLPMILDLEPGNALFAGFRIPDRLSQDLLQGLD